MPVSLSSEVAPEFREYFRASTTVINAVIGPLVGRYLSNIGRRLEDRGITGDLLVMQSSGGVYSAEAAVERPVFMVESGPAAGAVAATHIGAAAGHTNLISFDMGGTTAKVCMILGGEPRVTKDYTVGAEAQSGAGAFGGADGYPVRTPVIDLVEIGAGRRLDRLGGFGRRAASRAEEFGRRARPGLLRAGRNTTHHHGRQSGSGQAEPGILCGRVHATRPGSLCGCHQRTLRRSAGNGRRSGGRRDHRNRQLNDGRRTETGLGPARTRPAGLPVGCVRRRRTRARRAYRTGQRHGGRADSIEPRHPRPRWGCWRPTSAWIGALTHLERAENVDATELDQKFRTLEEGEHVGVACKHVQRRIGVNFRRSIEMRYYGQSFELDIPTPDGTLDESRSFVSASQLSTKITNVHTGSRFPDEPVEFVNLRLVAVQPITKPATRPLSKAAGEETSRVKGRRRVFFAELGGWTDTDGLRQIRNECERPC